MLFIWGFRSYVSTVAMFTFVCQACHNPAAHRLSQITRKFTFFFVPLFPVSKRYVLTCAACGTQSRLSKEQVAELTAPAQRESVAQAAPAIETIPETPSS